MGETNTTVALVLAFMLALGGCHRSPRYTIEPARQQPTIEWKDCPVSLLPPVSGQEPSAGPLYLRLSVQGLVRVTEAEVRTVDPDASQSWFGRVLDGEVWFSDEHGVGLIGQNGELRGRDDLPAAARLELRRANEVWAVHEDGVSRFHGRRWTTPSIPRRLGSELRDLTVVDDEVWIATDTGLHRRTRLGWRPGPELPPFMDSAELDTYRGQLVVRDQFSFYVRDGDAWRLLVWTPSPSWGGQLSDRGFLVRAVKGPNPVIKLYSAQGERCMVTSEPLPGSAVTGLAVDGLGRTWAATDRSLSVLEPDGHVVRQWGSGELLGVGGRIEDIVVVGAGPSPLPRPTTAPIHTIVGRLRFGPNPVVGARVSLCATWSCPAGSLVARTMSESDGSYRFEGIVEGEYHVHVDPQSVSGCTSLGSTMQQIVVATATDCNSPDPQLLCAIGDYAPCVFHVPSLP